MKLRTNSGSLFCLLILGLFFIGFLEGICHAQKPGEGVLHNLARAVIAVPEAVLKSMHGAFVGDGPDGSGPYGYGDGYGVAYPSGWQSNYGTVRPEVGVPPAVVRPAPPSYVTYNLMILRKNNAGKAMAPAVVQDRPLPFDYYR